MRKAVLCHSKQIIILLKRLFRDLITAQFHACPASKSVISIVVYQLKCPFKLMCLYEHLLYITLIFQRHITDIHFTQIWFYHKHFAFFLIKADNLRNQISFIFITDTLRLCQHPKISPIFHSKIAASFFAIEIIQEI